jgi:endonuclease G, mitochondrial
MIIDQTLVYDSINRWRGFKLKASELSKRIGETDRTACTTSEQRQRRYAAILSQSGNAGDAHATIERMLGGNDLVGINYLQMGTLCSHSVCRIHLRNSTGATVGFGTGSLVAPGLLLTNHHVISSAAEAGFALAEFDYESDVRGVDKTVVSFAILADPPPLALEGLDFCLAAVSARSIDGQHSLNEFGWLSLNPEPGKAFVGEYLTIVQHPQGERKQVCVRENKLLKYDAAGNTIWYMTDTVPGSSGSPVFNGSWQIVALHHSGVPKMDNKGRWLTVDGKIWDASMDESQVAWEANEGIRISRILEYIQTVAGTNPLAAILRQNSGGSLPPTTLLSTSGAGPENIGVSSSTRMEDGELRITIPVHIGVRVGALPQSLAAALPAPPPAIVSSLPVAGAVAGLEKVVVDQSNYKKRPGYDPAFLGAGKKLLVPLPTLPGGAAVLQFTQSGKKKSELKYWNYSVVMNKTRKLAFYSAVNVDANLRPTDGGRDGDRWYFDTRVAEEFQLGPEFYGEQKTFEVDRSQNPFDRGHLTRRLDAQWGHDDEESSRNGNDSFHWTNCSPQHWRYNQGQKKWLGLEDYVVLLFAKRTGRACIFNGPVFDAPLSKKGADERPVPNIGGKGRKDPTFGGFAIPKLFFKVVSCERSTGTLAAAAFLMSQEDLLAAEDRIAGLQRGPNEVLTEAEARLYQVSIADLEKFTGLGFGPLKAADTFIPNEAFTGLGPVPIAELKDIRLS